VPIGKPAEDKASSPEKVPITLVSEPDKGNWSLAISTHQPWEDPSLEPELASFTSNVLPLFVNNLEGQEEGQVLDVGPICGSNITFFAQRVKRLYICDMLLCLDRNRRKGLPLNRGCAVPGLSTQELRRNLVVEPDRSPGRQ